MKCKDCGGPVIPGFLVSSYYCKNECDLKGNSTDGEKLWYSFMSDIEELLPIQMICWDSIEKVEKHLNSHKMRVSYHYYICSVKGTSINENEFGYGEHTIGAPVFVEWVRELKV